MENMAFGALCGTQDKREGVMSFLEKRNPSYQGK